MNAELRKLKRTLEDTGWVQAAHGSTAHIKMTKPGHRPLNLPGHNEKRGPGFAAKVLKQAG